MTVVFRVVKTKNYTMMSNQHLKDKRLTLKAKGLMSVMLSLPENWDYTLRGLSAISREGVDAISEAVKELERSGYVIRNRKRDERGRLSGTEYLIYEDCHMNSQPAPDAPKPEKPKRENPRLENPVQEKPVQENPKQEKPEQENPAQLNTNSQRTKKSKTDISRTHQSIYPAKPEAAGRPDGMDRIGLIDAYSKIIKENIEYDCMVSRYGKERLDETVELMLEVVLSNRPYIRIAGDDFPREVVKSRFLKINSGHLEYVFDCIDKNTTKVGNIKAYLLAALYNAPATMDSYYRAEVNHDLYGC